VAASFDGVVAELATVSRWGQLVAKIEDWVEGLPLPKAMPAAVAGQSRRLDRVAEVRALARAWRNCLAEYVTAINAGKCAVYLWEEPEKPAACLVKRHGRLGWFLDDAKGPRNAAIEPDQFEIIAATFANIGVGKSRAVTAIEKIIYGFPDGWATATPMW
jgi:hypothetical protein